MRFDRDAARAPVEPVVRSMRRVLRLEVRTIESRAARAVEMRVTEDVERLDAVAGCEFVDDRLRLRE